LKVEEIIIRRRKPNEKNLEQVKKEVITFVKSAVPVEYKKEVQELYWKYRKKGLRPKEAWKKAMDKFTYSHKEIHLEF